MDTLSSSICEPEADTACSMPCVCVCVCIFMSVIYKALDSSGYNVNSSSVVLKSSQQCFLSPLLSHPHIHRGMHMHTHTHTYTPTHMLSRCRWTFLQVSSLSWTFYVSSHCPDTVTVQWLSRNSKRKHAHPAETLKHWPIKQKLLFFCLKAWKLSLRVPRQEVKQKWLIQPADCFHLMSDRSCSLPRSWNSNWWSPQTWQSNRPTPELSWCHIGTGNIHSFIHSVCLPVCVLFTQHTDFNPANEHIHSSSLHQETGHKHTGQSSAEQLPVIADFAEIIFHWHICTHTYDWYPIFICIQYDTESLFHGGEMMASWALVYTLGYHHSHRQMV